MNCPVCESENIGPVVMHGSGDDTDQKFCRDCDFVFIPDDEDGSEEFDSGECPSCGAIYGADDIGTVCRKCGGRGIIEGRESIPSSDPVVQSIDPLRVWWIPQVPMEPFYVPVDSPKEAQLIMNTLADYDRFQFENRIKPDYCNAGGLQIFEDGDWMEWECETCSHDIDHCGCLPGRLAS